MVPAPDDAPAEPIFIRPNALPVAEVAAEGAEEDIIELELVEETPAPEPQALSPPPDPPREIVLLGAGHAHLQIVTWWRGRPIPNARLTLVSAFDRAAYSGMLAGVIAGKFQPEDMLIDLPRLCDRCGVQLVVDRAIALHPAARRIELAHQPALVFDAASINIGSVPGQEPLWQSHRMLLA
ncbi:MAG TPA: hypothetical protein VFG20_15135, partial [Planctomycetaceae bacterium]|nr:hypothetical protein [Planctomycetaceae bacterium]